MVWHCTRRPFGGKKDIAIDISLTDINLKEYRISVSDERLEELVGAEGAAQVRRQEDDATHADIDWLEAREKKQAEEDKIRAATRKKKKKKALKEAGAEGGKEEAADGEDGSDEEDDMSEEELDTDEEEVPPHPLRALRVARHARLSPHRTAPHHTIPSCTASHATSPLRHRIHICIAGAQPLGARPGARGGGRDTGS